jgi:hypothetical protein
MIMLSYILKKFFYSSRVKNMGFVIQQTWVQIPVLPAHPMTLGKLHDFCELQIHHMDNNLSEIWYVNISLVPDM